MGGKYSRPREQVQRPVPRQEQVCHVCGKAKEPVRLGPTGQGREVEDETRGRGPD